MIDWHRLFGLILTDFFNDSLWSVELEKDLSLKRQLLDVVILKKSQGKDVPYLPDGLDNLKTHNLLSYKSIREPFDDWALHELIGHYVNYRKQVSPSFDKLLPESKFQLYGVSSRYPQKLAKQVKLITLQQGVYDISCAGARIRLIVLKEIPQAKHNALWHLFSANPKDVIFGTQHYEHYEEISTLLNQLYENYQLEGLTMPYTMDDFRRDYVREHLDDLSAEEILKYAPLQSHISDLATEELLKRLSIKKLLEKLSTKESGINEEVLKKLLLESIQQPINPKQEQKH